MTENESYRLKLLPGCSLRFPLVTAILAFIEVVAAARTLDITDTLAARTSLSLPFEFVISLLWATLFVIATISSLRGGKHTLRLGAWSLAAFAMYNVARWMLFVQADYDRQRLPLLGLMTCIFVLILVAYLLRHRRTQPQKMETMPDDAES